MLCDLKYLKLPCELTAMKRSVLFATLALFWFATAIELTYRGPFYSGLTGNGYLGSWTALACALYCSSQTSGLLFGHRAKQR